MSDIARMVDGTAPEGPASHQTLLDQMHVGLDGSRPPLLDDALYRDMVELKSFRHLVRHHYGIDLIPAKVDANIERAERTILGFEAALARLKKTLETP